MTSRELFDAWWPIRNEATDYDSAWDGFRNGFAARDAEIEAVARRLDDCHDYDAANLVRSLTESEVKGETD